LFVGVIDNDDDTSMAIVAYTPAEFETVRWWSARRSDARVTGGMEKNPVECICVGQGSQIRYRAPTDGARDHGRLMIKPSAGIDVHKIYFGVT
jgi:hypothetical protein